MKMELRAIGLTGLLLLLGLADLSAQPAPPTSLADQKVALIVIQPPSGWSMTKKKGATTPPTAQAPSTQMAWSSPPAAEAKQRFMAAVEMAEEFKREGADVEMIFKGPATLWLSIDDPPANPQGKSGKGFHGPHDAIAQLKALGVKIRSDDWVGKQYNVTDKVSAVSDHPKQGERISPGALLARGYHILIF